MTNKVFEVLSRRYEKRKPNIDWVFWHIYRDPFSGNEMIEPYKYRKTILKTLCKKVGVKHFGFHALRHSGASIMDQNNVPIGAIQRILGHENRSTTEIYLHSLDYAEREAINVYESARENSHTTLTQGIETSEE
jgi:integrase